MKRLTKKEVRSLSMRDLKIALACGYKGDQQRLLMVEYLHRKRSG